MNRMLVLGLCLFHALMNAGESSRLKADERIIFYPAIVQDSPGRTKVQVEILGYVFEPEKARVSVAALREVLEFAAVIGPRAEPAGPQRRTSLFEALA